MSASNADVPWSMTTSTRMGSVPDRMYGARSTFALPLTTSVVIGVAGVGLGRTYDAMTTPEPGVSGSTPTRMRALFTPERSVGAVPLGWVAESVNATSVRRSSYVTFFCVSAGTCAPRSYAVERPTHGMGGGGPDGLHQTDGLPASKAG